VMTGRLLMAKTLNRKDMRRRQIQVQIMEHLCNKT
jgi:hypothetical protein